MRLEGRVGLAFAAVNWTGLVGHCSNLFLLLVAATVSAPRIVHEFRFNAISHATRAEQKAASSKRGALIGELAR
jgi:hypothetical protein